MLVKAVNSQTSFGIAVQAPFFRLLFTQVSMQAMPVQPSSTVAYLDPSLANARPARSNGAVCARLPLAS
jgi:hypothetical protein